MPNALKLVPIFVAVVLATTAADSIAAPLAPAGFKLSKFAKSSGNTLTSPDDIALLGGDIFVGWQNGVGTKGEANPTTGQTQSEVVEYSPKGKLVRHWSLKGKVDGLGGDQAGGMVIATVNEDGNSSLYTIKPTAPAGTQVVHYRYSPRPDAKSSGGVSTGGGTDAVVVAGGAIYLSASNPADKRATAAFRVHLDSHKDVAHLSATFADDAHALDALTGGAVTLALTDPDSNAQVPDSSPRFGGDFVLDSQADQQLVFASGLGTSNRSLTLLNLTHGASSAGVDDIRWARSGGGALYIVDLKANVVYKLKGPFKAGQAFGSLDTVGSASDTTEVDTLDLHTGALTPFVTGLKQPKGLLWAG
ncbi:MAG: hypothetical protein JO206_01445 [Solirubrobacterales bacterium]|nr:hypothetical protein [Solirubrobacterales bacterium]MBV9471601.1 hypothetical protein [Solirubrobacterales bacterium]